MDTVLVTGGAGFIGSHIVDSLIEMNKKVIIVDNLSGSTKDNVNSKSIFYECSTLDEEKIKDIFEKHSIDYVLHLAAYAAENTSHFVKKFNYQNNLIGSINLINAAINHHVKCFVFFSSVAVYGDQTPPFSEKTFPIPCDPYGISKLAIELELKSCYKMFGLNYVNLRLHNVFGPRQNIADQYRNVFGIFINQIIKGEKLTLFGDGKQSRAFTYINDILPFMTKVPFENEFYGQTFNVGTDNVTTVNEIASLISEYMKVELGAAIL